MVRRVVQNERGGNAKDTGNDTFHATKAADLLPEEYEAFVGPDRDAHEKDRFIKKHVSLFDFTVHFDTPAYEESVRWLLERLGTIVEVTRLREVRVLKGFSRLAPVSGEKEDGEGHGTFAVYDSKQPISPSMVSADLDGLKVDQRWLPGVEVYGEGIFLSLQEETLQRWENDTLPRDRARRLEARRLATAGYLPEVTPRLLLLHTLAHSLIRQLSFECGYSLASLRERLYASSPGSGSPMAGILIYTSAGDAEGSLGGLVREAQLDRLLPTILTALQGAEWCSSDPLCRESGGQGIGGLNLAACHACSLVPETSCVMSNRLLDRALLLGSPNAPSTGFFSPLLAAGLGDHEAAALVGDGSAA